MGFSQIEINSWELPITDAVPGTVSEWQVLARGHQVFRTVGEAFRIEFFRFREIFGVVVQTVDRYQDWCVLFDFKAGFLDHVIFFAVSIQERSKWVPP